MSDVKCQMSDVRFQMSEVRCQMSAHLRFDDRTEPYIRPKKGQETCGVRGDEGGTKPACLHCTATLTNQV